MARDSQPSAPSWLVELVTAVLKHAAVKAALAEVLDEMSPAQSERPELLTPDGLCTQLQISRSKLDGLVAAGLPYVTVGSTKRFRLHEVINHLRSREEKAA
jgi:hypothetical protein